KAAADDRRCIVKADFQRRGTLKAVWRRKLFAHDIEEPPSWEATTAVEKDRWDPQPFRLPRLETLRATLPRELASTDQGYPNSVLGYYKSVKKQGDEVVEAAARNPDPSNKYMSTASVDEEKVLLEALGRKRVFQECPEKCSPDEALQRAADIIDRETERITLEWEQLIREPGLLTRKSLASECDRLMGEACVVIEFVFQRAVPSPSLRDSLHLGVLAASAIVCRVATFSYERAAPCIAVRHLAYAIRAVEACIPLRDTKYIFWLVQLYSLLCACVEASPQDGGAQECYQNALKVANEGIESISLLQKLENMAPPVPEDRQRLINEALLIVKGLGAKYEFWTNSLASGSINPDCCSDLQAHCGIGDGDNPAPISTIDLLLEVIKVPSSLLTPNDSERREDNTDGEGAEREADLLQRLRVDFLRQVIDYASVPLGVIADVCKEYEELISSKAISTEDSASAEDEEQPKNAEGSSKRSEAEAAASALSIGAHASLLELTFRLQLQDKFDELLEVFNQRLKYRHLINPPLVAVDSLVTRGEEKPVPSAGWTILTGDLNRFSSKWKLGSLEVKKTTAGEGLAEPEPLPTDKESSSSNETPVHVYLIGQYLNLWELDNTEDGEGSIRRICNVGLVFSREAPVDSNGVLTEQKEIHYLTGDTSSERAASAALRFHCLPLPIDLASAEENELAPFLIYSTYDEPSCALDRGPSLHALDDLELTTSPIWILTDISTRSLPSAEALEDSSGQSWSQMNSIIRVDLRMSAAEHVNLPFHHPIYLGAQIDLDCAVVQYRRVRLLSLMETVDAHPEQLPTATIQLARLLEGDCGDALIDSHEQLVLDAAMLLWHRHCAPHLQDLKMQGSRADEQTSIGIPLLTRLVQVLCGLPRRLDEIASTVAEICLRIDQLAPEHQVSTSRKCYSALRGAYDILAWNSGRRSIEAQLHREV
ncbi:hypothetical protein FOZ63_015277, partial [Perkinsus olseni]